mmetsp:Transcript_20213/g.49844  ORF Transcript_20213/g.49844 Transcript_20213/m.49844 type:complete len:420 (-) Transcript_20213:623-1882(-)
MPFVQRKAAPTQAPPPQQAPKPADIFEVEDVVDMSAQENETLSAPQFKAPEQPDLSCGAGPAPILDGLKGGAATIAPAAAAAAGPIVSTDLTMLAVGVVVMILVVVNVALVLYLALSKNSASAQKEAPPPPQPSVHYISVPQPPPVQPVYHDDEPHNPRPRRQSAPGGEEVHNERMKRSSSARSLKSMGDRAETLEEAKAFTEERNNEVRNMSPREILESLKAGNSRFWNGTPERVDMSAVERRQLIHGQVPKVAVLGCADSRVPIEIVFDQGPGDIFTLRVAGNVHGSHVAGSLDYAVHHLNIKLVVVLGHEGCGAVKAAQLAEADIKGEQPYLRDMLLGMKKDLKANSKDLDSIADPRARDREAVIANTRAQVHKILEDKAMRAKVKAGELLVVGGFYEISSGVVDLFEVVNPELLK